MLHSAPKKKNTGNLIITVLGPDEFRKIPNTANERRNRLIPPGDRFALSIRDYIRKDTQRGPDSSLVLRSRVLQLVRP